VIILDTHIWVWWVHQDDRLPTKTRSFIAQHETRHIGISAISCWEVAKLVERGRLRLPLPTDQWLHAALAYPGVRLLDLTPDIAADACNLPETFHSDPADQIIVATARHYRSELMTMDQRILSYQHVPLARVD
jgi:PIN domain nuclease of toxin-antitoxin system